MYGVKMPILLMINKQLLWREAVKELKTIDIVIHLPVKSYTKIKLAKTDKSSFNDLNKKNFERIMRLKSVDS